MPYSVHLKATLAFQEHTHIPPTPPQKISYAKLAKILYVLSLKNDVLVDTYFSHTRFKTNPQKRCLFFQMFLTVSQSSDFNPCSKTPGGAIDNIVYLKDVVCIWYESSTREFSNTCVYASDIIITFSICLHLVELPWSCWPIPHNGNFS